jgi:hypothetical protein
LFLDAKKLDEEEAKIKRLKRKKYYLKWGI